MDQRDNAPITLDSAERYIEAALDLTVARSWLACNNHFANSLERSIGSNGETIASTDASAAFLALQAQFSATITPSENHLIVTDAMFLPSDEVAYAIKVLLQFGAGSEKILNTSYAPVDYWHSGYDPTGRSIKAHMAFAMGHTDVRKAQAQVFAANAAATRSYERLDLATVRSCRSNGPGTLRILSWNEKLLMERALN